MISYFAFCVNVYFVVVFFFVKQKTAYEMRISDWSSDVCSSDLLEWDPAELSRAIGCVFENPFTQISGIKDTVFEEIAFGLENKIGRASCRERVCQYV